LYSALPISNADNDPVLEDYSNPNYLEGSVYTDSDSDSDMEGQIIEEWHKELEEFVGHSITIIDYPPGTSLCLHSKKKNTQYRERMVTLTV
jgi:hypothetical protein